MGKQGVVSVKMLLLSMMLVSVFLICFGHLKQRNIINNVLRSQEVELDSTLANYDTFLYKHYGIYGVNTVLNEGTFETGWQYEIESESLEGDHNLSESTVIKNQILSYMSIRMPVNFIEIMTKKLEIVTDSDKTKPTLELKSKVYDLMTGFDELLMQRALDTQSINSFKKEKVVQFIGDVNGEWSIWHTTYEGIVHEYDALKAEADSLNIAYENYKEIYDAIELPTEIDKLNLAVKFESWNIVYKSLLLTEKEKAEAEESGESIINRVANFEYVITSLIKSHESLISILKELAVSKRSITDVIEDTMVEISQSDGLEIILDSIEVEMVTLNKQLDSEILSDDAFDNICLALENNIETLNMLLVAIEVDENPFEKYVLIDDISYETLRAYNNEFTLYMDDGSYQVDTGKEKIYNDSIEKNEEVYAPEPGGNIISSEVTIIETKNVAKFWSITGLKNKLSGMYDALVINEYILSTFKSFASPSISDVDGFYKYERASFLKNGEIEYILFGNASESINIASTMACIYGVRTIMNTIHIYMDPKKLASSEAIGWGVAGWTGFLAPVVTQVVRVAWAAGESAFDMKDLVKGEGVSFLKLYPSEWKLDIGLPSKSLEEPIPELQFTYHDYLRFMLLTLDTETKINRIKNLISLNLYVVGRETDLSHYFTSFKSIKTIELFGSSYDSVLERSYEE